MYTISLSNHETTCNTIKLIKWLSNTDIESTQWCHLNLNFKLRFKLFLNAITDKNIAITCDVNWLVRTRPNSTNTTRPFPAPRLSTRVPLVCCDLALMFLRSSRYVVLQLQTANIRPAQHNIHQQNEHHTYNWSKFKSDWTESDASYQKRHETTWWNGWVEINVFDGIWIRHQKENSEFSSDTLTRSRQCVLLFVLVFGKPNIRGKHIVINL